jgi:hypothetical protein
MVRSLTFTLHYDDPGNIHPALFRIGKIKAVDATNSNVAFVREFYMGV